MELMPPNRATVWYTGLVTLLGAGIALGVMLFVMQARGGSSTAAGFAIEAPQAVDCPTEGRSPTCYRFDVTNTGDGEGPMRCAVSQAENASAVFTASGGTTYESEPVPPGAMYALYVEVEAADGATAQPPTVGCTAA
jgi:hypothetical protein